MRGAARKGGPYRERTSLLAHPNPSHTDAFWHEWKRAAIVARCDVEPGRRLDPARLWPSQTFLVRKDLGRSWTSEVRAAEAGQPLS